MEDTTSNIDFSLSRKITKSGNVEFHILQRQKSMATEEWSLFLEGVPTPYHFETDLSNPYSFYTGLPTFFCVESARCDLM